MLIIEIDYFVRKWASNMVNICFSCIGLSWESYSFTTSRIFFLPCLNCLNFGPTGIGIWNITTELALFYLYYLNSILSSLELFLAVMKFFSMAIVSIMWIWDEVGAGSVLYSYHMRGRWEWKSSPDPLLCIPSSDDARFFIPGTARSSFFLFWFWGQIGISFIFVCLNN